MREVFDELIEVLYAMYLTAAFLTMATCIMLLVAVRVCPITGLVLFGIGAYRIAIGAVLLTLAVGAGDLYTAIVHTVHAWREKRASS